MKKIFVAILLAAIFIFGGQNNYVAAQDLNFQDKFITL